MLQDLLKKLKYKMATLEQVLATATDFMLKSPPGELKEVVNDIRHLLADESILNPTIFPTFREYNTEQMIQVPLPDKDYSILICKEGEVSAFVAELAFLLSKSSFQRDNIWIPEEGKLYSLITCLNK